MTNELRKIVEQNSAELVSSAKDFEAIYRITFSQESLVMAEDTDGFRIHRYTYGQVKERIEAAAAGIYAAIGETHGWVGLEMENSVDWIAAFWGLLKSGNKPYLINTRHPESLSNRILKTLGIQTILCQKAGRLDAAYIEWGSLQGEECPAAFENEIAIATSATSLQESICFYDGAAVAAQILNAEGILKESKRMAQHHNGSLKQLAFLPFYHIFGLFAVFFWFTFYQRTLVFLRDLAPDTILKTCRKHEVTHIFAVPMLWHTIEKQVLKQAEQQGRLEKLQKGVRLCTKLQNIFPYWGAKIAQKMMRQVTDPLFGQSVKFCISGGSHLRQSALELINGIGYPLHNGYGMSEIGISSVELAARPKERNRNSIGHPFCSVEYRLDEQGVLQVRGASLCTRRMKGGEVLPAGEWLDTGDIMEKDAAGKYFIRGRKGDTVIGESGENINPDMLEQLFTLKDALMYSILGLPGEGGEVLSMVVQVSPYLPAERIAALREQLRRTNETLPTTQQIRKFHMTYDPIAPETAIKVGRQYLKRGIEQGSIRLLPFAKAEAAAGFDRESPLAQKVLEVIAPMIGVAPEEIDCEAHLMMDLGVSSLQYFSMLSALAEEFGVTAGEKEEYSYTVREFCEYIERHL